MALTKTEQLLGAGYDQPGERKYQSGPLDMQGYGYDQSSSRSKAHDFHTPSERSLTFVEVKQPDAPIGYLIDNLNISTL